MRKIQKFLALNSKERSLLLKTFFLLNAIRLGFVFLEFSTLQAILNHFGRFSWPWQLHQIYTVDKIVWAVEVSTHFSPGGAKCLARALATQVLMQRQNYVPQLLIGVLKSPETFRAHAWVEYQGKVIIGQLPDLAQYRALLPPKPCTLAPSD